MKDFYLFMKYITIFGIPILLILLQLMYNNNCSSGELSRFSPEGCADMYGLYMLNTIGLMYLGIPHLLLFGLIRLIGYVESYSGKLVLGTPFWLILIILIYIINKFLHVPIIGTFAILFMIVSSFIYSKKLKSSINENS